MAVSEMMLANPETWDTESKKRRYHADEAGFRSVQILGCDPESMAQAARLNVAADAHIIRHQYGMSSQEGEQEVRWLRTAARSRPGVRIAGPGAGGRPPWMFLSPSDLVPVGIPDHRNGVEYRAAGRTSRHSSADCAWTNPRLFIQGRGRIRHHQGDQQAVSIPVIANGDIDSVDKAHRVLAYTVLMPS